MVPVNYFSPDELQTLISIIQEQHGLKLTRQQFTDISFDLFEDIYGLEGIDPEQAMEIISRYLSQTTRIIENTSLGRFPESTTVN